MKKQQYSRKTNHYRYDGRKAAAAGTFAPFKPRLIDALSPENKAMLKRFGFDAEAMK